MFNCLKFFKQLRFTRVLSLRSMIEMWLDPRHNHGMDSTEMSIFYFNNRMLFVYFHRTGLIPMSSKVDVDDRAKIA